MPPGLVEGLSICRSWVVLPGFLAGPWGSSGVLGDLEGPMGPPLTDPWASSGCLGGPCRCLGGVLGRSQWDLGEVLGCATNIEGLLGGSAGGPRGPLGQFLVVWGGSWVRRGRWHSLYFVGLLLFYEVRNEANIILFVSILGVQHVDISLFFD